MKGDIKTEFSIDKSAVGTVKLEIQVPHLGHQQLPIEVRDTNLRLLGRAVTETQLTFNEGRYVLRAVLPDGRVESSVIDVYAGIGPSVSMDWESRSRFKIQSEKQTEILRKVETELLEVPAHGWYMRFLTFIDNQWRPATDPPNLEPIDHQIHEDITATAFLVHGQYPGLYFMEVRKHNGRRVTLAMPIAAQSEAVTCQVFVGDDGDSLRTYASTIGMGPAELVYEYMETGALEEVTEVMEDAERLLLDKLSNPIEAALGGYALLRLGDIERLHDWPKNLSAWFEWLPDGAVIAGELEAQKGNHDNAADYFLTALKRGLPIFYEGFSTLSSRLRHYSLYGSKLLSVSSKNDQITAALEKLGKWSHAIDRSAFLLTITGISLEESDITLQQELRPQDGWLMFDPTLNSSYGNQGYWTANF